MASIREIRATSLRAEATRAIRNAILSSEIVPGRIYSVPELAGRLGVSATPVREALLTLASLGVIEPVRNRGFRVSPLSEHDLEEILELRALIEIPLLRRLAGRLDTAADGELQRLADGAAEAARRDRTETLMAKDRAFYLRLLELGANPVATELLTELRDYADLRGLSRLSAGLYPSELAGRLQATLDALRLGSRDGVELALRENLDLAGRTWSNATAAASEG